MSRPSFLRRLARPVVGLGGALLALVALLGAHRASAESAVLTRNGTLYEIYSAHYGDVIPGATGTHDADIPVMALRTTLPSGEVTLEVVDGTLDPNDEDSASVDYDEETGTLFLVYTKYQGFMADVHVAIKRDGRWGELNVIPNLGLYLSLNPKILVTRQQFVDFDGKGGVVNKRRSIVSVVLWEESGPQSQARYAVAFVEDGVLKVDSISTFNLNQLDGVTGPTSADGLPFSSYQFPALERDPASNGGVIVSFANLASGRQSSLRITYPDDIRDLVPPGSTSAGPGDYARTHFPIGRHLQENRIPAQVNVMGPVGSTVSPAGLPTFYWVKDGRFFYLRGDAAPEDAPSSLALRPDFPAERALSLVTKAAEKN